MWFHPAQSGPRSIERLCKIPRLMPPEERESLFPSIKSERGPGTEGTGSGKEQIERISCRKEIQSLLPSTRQPKPFSGKYNPFRSARIPSWFPLYKELFLKRISELHRGTISLNFRLSAFSLYKLNIRLPQE